MRAGGKSFTCLWEIRNADKMKANQLRRVMVRKTRIISNWRERAGILGRCYGSPSDGLRSRMSVFMVFLFIHGVYNVVVEVNEVNIYWL